MKHQFCFLPLGVIIQAFFLLLFFASCKESNIEDSGYDESKNGKVVALEAPDDGWEVGMCNYNQFVVAHEDTARDVIFYYMNESSKSASNGIVITLNTNGEIVGFGRSYNVANVWTNGNKVLMASLSGKNDLNICEVEATGDGGLSSKVTDTYTSVSSEKSHLMQQINLFNFFLNKVDEKKIGKYVSAYNRLQDSLPYDESWLQNVIKMISVGVKTIKEEGLVQSFGYTVDDCCQNIDNFHNLFYGLANPHITQIEKRSDGGYNVTVLIESLSDIPEEYGINMENGENIQITKNNKVYFGVLACSGKSPRYNKCDTYSEEELITFNKEAKTLEHTFVVYSNNDSKTLLRPYLRVDMDQFEREKMKVNDSFIRYGQYFPLTDVSDITVFENLIESCCSAGWEKEKHKFAKDVTFSIPIQAKKIIPALGEDVEFCRWGIILRKGDNEIGYNTNENFVISEDDQSLSGTIDVSFREDELNIDYTANVATPKEKCMLYTFVEYRDFRTKKVHRLRGLSTPLHLIYSKQPEMTFIRTYGYKNYSESGIGLDMWTVGISYAGHWLPARSNNDTDCMLQGVLFLDSIMACKEGSGWDKTCTVSTNYQYGKSEQIYMDTVKDGEQRIPIEFYWNHIENRDEPGEEDPFYGKPTPAEGTRYFKFELKTKVGTIPSRNRLSYEPVYGAYGDPTRLDGFKASIKY